MMLTAHVVARKISCSWPLPHTASGNAAEGDALPPPLIGCGVLTWRLLTNKRPSILPLPPLTPPLTVCPECASNVPAQSRPGLPLRGAGRALPPRTRCDCARNCARFCDLTAPSEGPNIGSGDGASRSNDPPPPP
eukprot:CAMPEP_0198689278 /NCGR_PEP_ID=MMETSP1468-20131203/135013_1 /TAXON_ID=1461545 /ORGANISM="Mantoniella sp, Strain CCMP1436" /LENGTH=134 /DNA_ID=CAMNT_0044440083 /DNA_START=127 /DNA_END=526 /DNA_ORIENTATION=-